MATTKFMNESTSENRCKESSSLFDCQPEWWYAESLCKTLSMLLSVRKHWKTLKRAGLFIYVADKNSSLNLEELIEDMQTKVHELKRVKKQAENDIRIAMKKYGKTYVEGIEQCDRGSILLYVYMVKCKGGWEGHPSICETK